jgi:hypothetical protein
MADNNATSAVVFNAVDDYLREKKKAKRKEYYHNVQKPKIEAAKNKQKKPRATQPFKENGEREYKGKLEQFVKSVITTKSKTNYNITAWKGRLENGLETQKKKDIREDANGKEIKRTQTTMVVLKDFDKRYANGYQYIDLYEIKDSQIPNAKMGLFSTRSFKPGDVMGVYYGKIKKPNLDNYSCYALESEKHKMVMEPTTNQGGPAALYFGFQFANDPLQCTKSTMTRSKHHEKAHNFFIDDDFIARACCDIVPGDELYLFYGWKKEENSDEEPNCDCRGCRFKNEYIINPWSPH